MKPITWDDLKFPPINLYNIGRKLVTPWALGAFKARSYLRARGIDAIVTQYKLIEGQWKRGVTK
jgi:hypothetical protein